MIFADHTGKRARAALVPSAVRAVSGLGGNHIGAEKPAIAGQIVGPEQRPYAFGDGDLAARRLALLHEVYAVHTATAARLFSMNLAASGDR